MISVALGDMTTGHGVGVWPEPRIGGTDLSVDEGSRRRDARVCEIDAERYRNRESCLFCFGYFWFTFGLLWFTFGLLLVYFWFTFCLLLFTLKVQID